MTSVSDSFFTVKRRRKKCRFCGSWFWTSSPARKTCYSDECREKSRALIKDQNKRAQDRYKKRLRRQYVRNLGNEQS